jgi:hypothetical protein
MNDDRLESEIRSMLAGRDPGAAPARLHFAVRQVPTTVGRSSAWNRVAGRLTPLAAAFGTVAILAGLVILVGLMGFGRTPAPVGPGAALAPQSSWVPFDPTAEGVGIATPPNDVPTIVVVSACGILALATTLRPTSRRRRAVASIVIALSLAVVFTVRSTPLVGWTEGATAPGLGWVADTGGVISDARVFAVGPGSVLTYGFDLTDTGPVPVDLLGLAPDGDAWTIGSTPTDKSIGPGSIRVIAAGLLRDPDSFVLLPSGTRPWERVHLEPGERQFVILAARAGRCALGRDNRADSEQSNDVLDRVGVVYEVLGIRAMAIVNLPEPVSVPLQIGCDPAG